MSKALVESKNVAGLLEKMKGEITRCLPKHLTAERLTRIALTELRNNTKLQECEPMSFVAAIMQAAQLGLEPGILGSCYLIPFKNTKKGIMECTFMPGYRGFIDLARRSGQIVSLVARPVFSNDEFNYQYGLRENIIHKPTMEDRGQLVAVYSVAILKDGGHQFEVMSKNDVDKIRALSKSKDYGPWVSHYEEMAKKTVVRKLFKWLPCSVELQKMVSLDEQQEIGIQDIRATATAETGIDFIEGEVVQEKESALDKIKNAKTTKFISEESASDAQLKDIHMLSAVKDCKGSDLANELKRYGVETLSQLNTQQADHLINILNKMDDK